MMRTVVLLPQWDNDGRPFLPEDFERAEHRFFEIAGGYSKEGPISGAWRDGEGRIYLDVNWRYIVALNPGQFAAWYELVRELRREFRQEKMYIEVNGAPDIVED